jgi:hypothetical protein
MAHRLSRPVCTLVVVTLLLLVGCLETKYPLGPRQPGKVDLRYIGDWNMESRNEQGQVTVSKLIIRNLHNDEYFVEWNTGEDKPFRCTGYLTEIKGVQFANLQGLSDDGKLAESYIILRVDLDGDRLKLRNLEDEFFKERSFASSDELRKIVEENVDNDAMYEGDPLVATR